MHPINDEATKDLMDVSRVMKLAFFCLLYLSVRQ